MFDDKGSTVYTNKVSAQYKNYSLRFCFIYGSLRIKEKIIGTQFSSRAQHFK